jgi:hypothetical protein
MTGIGGQSMEKLIDGGKVEGRDRPDHDRGRDLLMGGVFPCTEDRFGAVIRTRMPYVGSVGALDMVNFGAPETVPEKLSPAGFLPAQPAGHADAHHGRGERAHGPLDRRAAQPDGGAGALLPARGRGLGARCARPALPRPGRARRCFRALEAEVRQTPAAR